MLVGLGLRNGKVAAQSVGSSARGGAAQGLVLEMELRRRSGRAVAETFVLVPGLGPSPSSTSTSRPLAVSPEPEPEPHTTGSDPLPSKLYLLSDHPAFLDPEAATSAQGAGGEDEPGSTFDLGLTEKQRRDREGVVLPYFDAQTDVGAGEGGRILYDMGREDDFDEEDDEI